MADIYEQWNGREVVMQLREPVVEGSPEGFRTVMVKGPEGQLVPQPKMMPVIVGKLRVMSDGGEVVYEIETVYDQRTKITYLVPSYLVLIMHRVDESHLVAP